MIIGDFHLEIIMVNTYVSDVFFNMDHSAASSSYANMDDNAEMLINMMTELGADSVWIPTVEELKEDFFSRL